ncbi:hypothetical protein ACVJGD_008166 [Bradyrhizobium sp. USDA 10063]
MASSGVLSNVTRMTRFAARTVTASGSGDPTARMNFSTIAGFRPGSAH